MAQDKTPEEIKQEAIQKVKRSMMMVNDVFDPDISDLIDQALADLGIAGVTNTALTDALVLGAVKTFCRMKFGEPDDYDRLKVSYDEQKAQLKTATGYTDWGV